MRERTLPARSSDRSEEYHLASQWRLMGRKFRKHKLALVGSAVLALFYLTAVLAGFLAPYDAITDSAISSTPHHKDHDSSMRTAGFTHAPSCMGSRPC